MIVDRGGKSKKPAKTIEEAVAILTADRPKPATSEATVDAPPPPPPA
jgi:hypothetical protein